MTKAPPHHIFDYKNNKKTPHKYTLLKQKDYPKIVTKKNKEPTFRTQQSQPPVIKHPQTSLTLGFSLRKAFMQPERTLAATTPPATSRYVSENQ